jgi:hypothetical protein
MNSSMNNNVQEYPPPSTPLIQMAAGKTPGKHPKSKKALLPCIQGNIFTSS